MYKYKSILAYILLTLSTQASATSVVFCFAEDLYYSGPMANVSATGAASASNPMIACTVVVPENSFETALAFFSETDVGDAVLEIKYVNKSFSERSADNYLESLGDHDLNAIDVKLRRPYRETDAALVLQSTSSYYYPTPPTAADRIGVCAYGYPKTGTANTTVSISSLGVNLMGRCYQTSGQYFED